MCISPLFVSCKTKKKEIAIVPTTVNTISSSSPSSSITKCVSPNVVASSNTSYVVFEAIYYDNHGSNGVQNHSNQLVVAKVKSNQVVASDANAMKNETNVAPPILVTSVSSPLTSVLQCNNNTSLISSQNGAIVKKPGIILLTQASLNKLFSTNDLNVINNNTNTNTNNNANNHIHSHQHDNNIRSKCNLVISTTNPNSIQQKPNNNQLTSVLMINSTTSTIDTTTGVVTLTSTTGPIQSTGNRNASNDNAQHNNQQVYISRIFFYFIHVI